MITERHEVSQRYSLPIEVGSFLKMFDQSSKDALTSFHNVDIFSNDVEREISRVERNSFFDSDFEKNDKPGIINENHIKNRSLERVDDLKRIYEEMIRLNCVDFIYISAKQNNIFKDNSNFIYIIFASNNNVEMISGKYELVFEFVGEVIYEYNLALLSQEHNDANLNYVFRKVINEKFFGRVIVDQLN